MAAALACLAACAAVEPAAAQFRVEEATISGLHAAIQSGETTCTQVIEAYIERARAYNGVCTALVTADGAPIAPATGYVRAGMPMKFPTETVAVRDVLPDLDEYRGPPLELGRMEQTVSDPTVQQQFGMRVGIPNAGQVNALETLNLRGERSVTCKGAFDAHPSSGPLPPGAPEVCEEFRKLPDALERAAELDARYGRNPDLEAMPMYCVAFSWKNWYDAIDMRATGGNDVSFAMDAPKYDSPDIANLRAKGAISFAVATASSTGLTARDGPETASSVLISGNFQDGAWGGQACNPYDTERVPRGTSNGSGVSVAANLAHCSICEQTSASCKGPASRNNVVNLLTTKGVTMDGGLGYSHSGDRAGIHCRTVEDAVRVLDALKGFESRDLFTAIPKALIPDEPYASFLVRDGDVASKPLSGMRVGVVREFMVKHTKNDEAISDQIDAEIKSVLRDELGATLVESIDPLYDDDPAVPNMTYTFEDAFAEILPHTAPEYFWQKERGELTFAVPGWDVTGMDYAVALAVGQAPLSPKLNLRSIVNGAGNTNSLFHVNKYLFQRGDARVKDWASWVANSKFQSDSERAGSINAIHAVDPRERPGALSYLKMQSVLRLVILKVMHENGIDVFVNPENTLPPFKLGGPGEPAVNDRGSNSCCQRFTALLGGPEMDVPAGYTRITYDPQYRLSGDKTRYETVTGTVRSEYPNPMPISLMLWAAPGSDSDVIKVASAYEAATHHRVPPPAFGPADGREGHRQ